MLEGRIDICGLGTPGPCEHVEGIALMCRKVINLWLETKHDVAGSEADKTASYAGRQGD